MNVVKSTKHVGIKFHGSSLPVDVSIVSTCSPPIRPLQGTVSWCRTMECRDSCLIFGYQQTCGRCVHNQKQEPHTKMWGKTNPGIWITNEHKDLERLLENTWRVKALQCNILQLGMLNVSKQNKTCCKNLLTHPLHCPTCICGHSPSLRGNKLILSWCQTLTSLAPLSVHVVTHAILGIVASTKNNSSDITTRSL